MKSTAIEPARWQRDEIGRIVAPDYGDVYHPAGGAFAQARHVFIEGNGLPQRWQRRARFVVLETGFGLGNNFLATWQAWRDDPLRCERLHFISVEQHPLRRDDMARLHSASALAELAQPLVRDWPPLTHNLHRLVFEGGRVQLTLAFGDASVWLRELVAEVDAFYLDGFAPDRNPQMWQPAMFAAMGRLAAPAATLATWSAARAVRDGLDAAGFVVRRAAGSGGKRDITLAEHRPRYRPPAPPGRRTAPTTHRHAIVVGAGLAGCATAWALAEQGWTSTVLDRHDAPAAEASGNPAGMFHGIVNRHDGAHARFSRSAALQAQRCIGEFVSARRVRGAVDGLLRLEAVGADVAAMRGVLDTLGLPPDYVQAFDTDAADAAAGLALGRPAWFYPGGGWVDPAGLAGAWLDAAGVSARFCGGVGVDALRRVAGGWELIDAAGRAIDAAETVVLANAHDALRLLGRPRWNIGRVRGQISMCRAEAIPALPRLPVSGGGYLLPPIDDVAVFGASAQRGDDDHAVRDADHRENLARLARLCGAPPERLGVGMLTGRTGWRMVSDDRLPVIGAVPLHGARSGDVQAPLQPVLAPRLVPREAGLFVLAALGSRGITWAALGARSIAAAVSGAPQPLEAGLLDALDPARFDCRRARRASAAG